MNSQKHDTTTPEPRATAPLTPGVMNVSAETHTAFGAPANVAYLVAVLHNGGGESHDCAVYEAIVVPDPAKGFEVTAGDSLSERIARTGTKLPYRLALRHFPSLPESWYRA